MLINFNIISYDYISKYKAAPNDKEFPMFDKLLNLQFSINIVEIF